VIDRTAKSPSGHSNRKTQEKVSDVKTKYLSTVAFGLGVLSLAAAAARTVGAQGNTPRDYDPPAVYQAAGPNGASILGTIEAFRTAIGGINNGNGGSVADGRREINWDGGGSSATSPGPSPFTVFLNTRGGLFTTTGSGFVQAPPAGMATTFGNLSYETAFQAFSPLRLFSPVGSNVTDATFFLPGSNGGVAATTKAFGAVFADVDQPDGSGPGSRRGNRGASTFVEFYGTAGNLLYSSTVAAAPGTGSLSFIGVLFADTRIARVRITTGDLAPGPDDDSTRDIVLMDDFIYAEPRQVQ
jgi:hypothetical protein